MKTKIKMMILAAVLFTAAAMGAAALKVHKIDAKLCTNCATCEKACPEDAISEGVVNGKKVRVIDPKLCTNCGECAKVCPEDCISEVAKDAKPAAKKSEPKKK